MNDFTKEELEQIIETFNWAERETSDPWMPILKGKIQSMIDNYCEHPDFNRAADCLDCGVSEYMCKKCGYIIYEGFQ